jgi:GNAT superfamily N-acetyltransferase
VFSSADIALARRIEAGHASSGITYIRNSADAMAVAGGWAVFGGVDSPFTQAIGIGMNGPLQADQLDQLEAFFRERGSPPVIDLCTLADAGLLWERGYVVQEISNVLVRDLNDIPAPAGPFTIEVLNPDEVVPWTRMVLQGFMDIDDVPDDLLALMSVYGPGFLGWFGLLDGVRVGTAAVEYHDGLCTLFGDVTLGPARGRGLQQHLILDRLQEAARAGCDLASASVMPGSISHRNYERTGFQLVYSRVKVRGH